MVLYQLKDKLYLPIIAICFSVGTTGVIELYLQPLSTAATSPFCIYARTITAFCCA